MKKKKLALLIFSGIISLILIVLNYIGTFRLCGGKNFGSCVDIACDIVINFFPIIPLFIFSLITYKMREGVYRAWWRYARIWIPVSILAIFVAPSYASNWMVPIEKGNVAAFFSLNFVMTSIVLIPFCYYLARKNKNCSIGFLIGLAFIGLISTSAIFYLVASIF